MVLYGTAQHESRTEKTESLKRQYGPPQHEAMTAPYPCSGSELGRPTIAVDSDRDDGETTTSPTDATRDVSATG